MDVWLVYEGVREIRHMVILNCNFPDDSSEDIEVGKWTIDSGYEENAGARLNQN